MTTIKLNEWLTGRAAVEALASCGVGTKFDYLHGPSKSVYPSLVSANFLRNLRLCAPDSIDSYRITKYVPPVDVDGWVTWPGGERPVDGDALVNVRFRDGKFPEYESQAQAAGIFVWSRGGGVSEQHDIIAYRIVQLAASAEPKAELEPEKAWTRDYGERPQPPLPTPARQKSRRDAWAAIVVKVDGVEQSGLPDVVCENPARIIHGAGRHD